ARTGWVALLAVSELHGIAGSSKHGIPEILHNYRCLHARPRPRPTRSRPANGTILSPMNPADCHNTMLHTTKTGT
ncbi:uncharacterized protein C8Q71DRAFT_791350, partial [Rhodofomes roseus]